MRGSHKICIEECEQLECSSICQICGKSPHEPRGPGCESTPLDMAWCEGPTHEDSRLMHLDCMESVDYTGFGDRDYFCPQCSAYYREHPRRTTNE